MKSFLTSLLVVGMVMMSSFTQPGTIDEVIGTLRTGDATGWQGISTIMWN